MLKALTDFFDRALTPNAEQTPQDRDHALQLATAVLLVEVARADYNEDISEDTAIVDLLRENLNLSDSEISLLVEEAKGESNHLASLQAFTRQLHEGLTLSEKHHVIEMLWRVALADQHLDKHEDHLVRKIAGLLYISHSDLIRIRNKVRPPN